MRAFLRKALLLIGLLPLPGFASILSVCTEASPEGFDVVQYNALTTTNASADVLMNRLVEYDNAQKRLVPSLAKQIDVSSDGLEYLFTLRENVAFHHTPWFSPSRFLNQDDVLFSFKRMLDATHPWHKINQSGYPHAQSLQWPALIKQIDSPEPMQVRIVLHEPQATFLATLSMGFASIYAKEYADQLMDKGTPELMNSQPIGTGPFKLKRYQKDAVVRYIAHPEYFLGAPKADRLIFAITPDSKVRLQRLKRGECHISLSPRPLDVDAAQHNPELKVLSTPAFMTAFVAINTQKPGLDQLKVRQAINLSFDQAGYLKSVFGQSASAAIGPYPANTWSFNDALKGYPYDPERAKALLAEAGYPDGFSTTIWTRPSGSLLNPNPSLGAQLLQADLAKIGIKASISVVEWGELIRRAKAGEHDLLFMGWAGDNGDPDNFLTPQFACSAVKTGTNFARFCDRELDQWIAKGRQLSDQAARSKLYEQAQARISEQALWLPLAHPNAMVLLRQGVSGYALSPFGRQDFSQTHAP